MKALAAGISEAEFLKLGKSKQKQYLKQYPMSAHRFLLQDQKAKKRGEKPEDNRPKKKKEPKKLKFGERREKPETEPGEPEQKPEKEKPEHDEKAPVKKRQFSRHVTRTQFAAMNDEDKAAYLERFPSSSHREMIPRVKSRPTRAVDAFASEEEEASYHAQLQAEIDSLSTETRASINRETIGAANDVTTDDLSEAGEDLRNNSEEVAGDVMKRFERQPKLLHRGLSAVRKLWSNDPDEDKDLSPKEKRDMHAVVNNTIRLALLGAGIVALAAGATPIAMVLGATIMDNWGRNSLKMSLDPEGDQQRKKDRADEARQKKRDAEKAAREEEREKKRQEKEKAEKEEEKRKKKEKKKQEKEQARLDEKAKEQSEEAQDDEEKEDETEEEEEPMKAAASTDFDDENSRTMKEIIKQVGEHMEQISGDHLRERMRAAYGEKASALVVTASGTANSIEELATLVGGTVEDGFVVTASARYEYNATTGRYNNG